MEGSLQSSEEVLTYEVIFPRKTEDVAMGHQIVEVPTVKLWTSILMSKVLKEVVEEDRDPQEVVTGILEVEKTRMILLLILEKGHMTTVTTILRNLKTIMVMNKGEGHIV